MFRIGQGYDIHIFEEKRPLILGGLKVRDNWGLLGHSDADVLVHANISSALDIDKDQVAIKATTKEKMDATGKGKSMEAYAICLITG